VEFHDRRPERPSARPEDYDRPLTKTALTEANRAFIERGVRGKLGPDEERARAIIRQVTKDRFNARRRVGADLESMGEYIEYLRGRADGTL
jgi:hypothetical protein